MAAAVAGTDYLAPSGDGTSLSGIPALARTNTFTQSQTVSKDWDELATDPPIRSAAVTHPNRMLSMGVVDSSNISLIESFDGDAGANTPLQLNCSYLNVIGQVQSQQGLYTNTDASTTYKVDFLHQAQQGTGNDVAQSAVTVHNYADGTGLDVDIVGSGAGMQIRQAHNSVHRPDKPSNYIGTGPFLQLWRLNSDLSTWTQLFTFDTNACAVWNSDWSDHLASDAPIQIRTKTHPNRSFVVGYIDAFNATQWQSIDLDAGQWTPIIVAASYMEFQCGISTPLATKTGAYTLTAEDNTILADATSAAFAVTLPPASNVPPGWVCRIKKIDSSANAVTVTAQGTNKIDGSGTLALSSQYAHTTLVSDGSANWNVF